MSDGLIPTCDIVTFIFIDRDIILAWANRYAIDGYDNELNELNEFSEEPLSPDTMTWFNIQSRDEPFQIATGDYETHARPLIARGMLERVSKTTWRKVKI